jgi:hypothetical protein
LAELLAGQFVNGLQGLSVVAGHSSAKQAKLLRKVMTLAVSVLSTGVPTEPLHSSSKFCSHSQFWESRLRLNLSCWTSCSNSSDALVFMKLPFPVFVSREHHEVAHAKKIV